LSDLRLKATSPVVFTETTPSKCSWFPRSIESHLSGGFYWDSTLPQINFASLWDWKPPLRWFLLRRPGIIGAHWILQRIESHLSGGFYWDNGTTRHLCPTLCLIESHLSGGFYWDLWSYNNSVRWRCCIESHLSGGFYWDEDIWYEYVRPSGKLKATSPVVFTETFLYLMIYLNITNILKATSPVVFTETQRSRICLLRSQWIESHLSGGFYWDDFHQGSEFRLFFVLKATSPVVFTETLILTWRYPMTVRIESHLSGGFYWDTAVQVFTIAIVYWKPPLRWFLLRLSRLTTMAMIRLKATSPVVFTETQIFHYLLC